MVHEGVAWFGEKSVVKVIVSEPTKACVPAPLRRPDRCRHLSVSRSGSCQVLCGIRQHRYRYRQAGQYYIKQDMSVTGTKIFDQNYALALPSNLETWQHGRADVIFPQINSDALVPGNYVIPLSVYVDYNGSTSGFTRVQPARLPTTVIKNQSGCASVQCQGCAGQNESGGAVGNRRKFTAFIL